MSPVKVHLDTDIGGDIDDLCALALLLTAPDVEVTGVTTVLEDGGRRAGYARYVLALAGRDDVPVAAGADLSLGYCCLPAVLPPEGRYWPEPVPPVPGPVEGALDLLKRSIEQEAIVVGIGPFTNLSLLEQRYPGILREAALYLMGGTIRPSPPLFPAWDHSMDYNVQADPSAAKLVLESSEPTLVPLEVTSQTALRRSHLPALCAAGRLGTLISRQAEVFAMDEQVAERYGRTCPGLATDIIDFQHDPLTCAVALGWDGVARETLPLVFSLEGGWLRMRQDDRGRPTRVVTAVDREQFSSYWLATVTGHIEPGTGASGFTNGTRRLRAHAR